MPVQPPRRTGWIVYAVFITIFLMLSIVVNGVLMVLLSGHFGSKETGEKRYEENYVAGDEDAQDKIAEIDLSGVIGFDGGQDGGGEGMVGEIKDQLDEAVKDKHVKAIVLRINSPGGEVVASDALYRALAEVRDDKKRKMTVISYVETVGASGAFYAAMGTDYIVANELSITASIGVIMESFSVGPYDDNNSLMHKLGVKSYTYKSGKFKDILNPTRTPTEEENTLVKNLIMEVYDKFVGIVADERNLDVETLKNGIADGRILSGKQAQEAGLVDELGYFDDAVDAAKELAKIQKAKVIRYSEPFSWRNVLRIFGKTATPKIQIELTPNPLKMQSGKLYLLPSYLFN